MHAASRAYVVSPVLSQLVTAVEAGYTHLMQNTASST
jgi:hypothetical protein